MLQFSDSIGLPNLTVKILSKEKIEKIREKALNKAKIINKNRENKI
jgi:hypothetical protein